VVGLAWNYGGLVGDLDTNSGLNSTQSGRVSNYALETMRHAGAQPIFSLRSLVPIGPKIEKFRGGEIPKSKYPRAQWNSVELSGTQWNSVELSGTQWNSRTPGRWGMVDLGGMYR